MSPKGKAKVKQQQISSLVPAYPALKKPLDQLGKNILEEGRALELEAEAERPQRPEGFRLLEDFRKYP